MSSVAAKYMAAPAAMEMGSAGNACWKTGRSARVAHSPESTAAAQLAVAATPLSEARLVRVRARARVRLRLRLRVRVWGRVRVGVS
eukprot:scaffold33221_cov55-Phaeocystis_antarctica.AAC.2